MTDKECFAIVSCLASIEKYLGTNLKVIICTDHMPLKTFMTTGYSSPRGRRARWLVYLQKFDLEITYIAGASNHLADMLS